ncbi:MAG: 1-acyl-sn-glycerol-3-phosphate acyltransferase [Methylotenera sp.]|nr:1-acyl-sn-glycerol-3-phosphate acyltransferase [Oligoflexia bacterium]
MTELPKIHAVFLRVFLFWTRFYRWLQVDQVWVHRELPDFETFSRRPVLWVANHVSGWDGLILQLLSFKFLPGHRFYAVMAAPGWRENRWLQAVGTIPMDAQKPMTIRSTFRLLTRSSQTAKAPLSIAYFPQGRIWPSTRRPLGFERGIEVLMRQHLAQEGAVVIPVAFHWEPTTSLRPQLFVRMGKPMDRALSFKELEGMTEALIDSVLCDRHLCGERVSSDWQPL